MHVGPVLVQYIWDLVSYLFIYLSSTPETGDITSISIFPISALFDHEPTYVPSHYFNFEIVRDETSKFILVKASLMALSRVI
jgi:hypothetical protein